MSMLTASTERQMLLDDRGFPQGDESDWDNYGPSGLRHVFQESSPTTLCGLPVDGLYAFPFLEIPVDEALTCAVCGAKRG